MTARAGRIRGFGTGLAIGFSLWLVYNLTRGHWGPAVADAVILALVLTVRRFTNRKDT